ncbi:MAG TPA: hypothetical protein VHK91_12895 [Flavisolibacter sp.]|jgi:predicted nicotinamide N-methyase|nr:hypothetical protein [Flavisolibacter sp.]
MKPALVLKSFRLNPSTAIELFVPDPLEVEKNFRAGMTVAPYWAKVWPSAIALSQFLLDHPELTRGKKVVELAAGLGLPSVIASRTCRSVLCTDHIPEAVAVAKANAVLHDASVMQCAVLDWHQLPETLSAEVLLLSDINYDPEQFPVLEKVLHRFLDMGTHILLSTPQRLAARSFIAPLLAYLQSGEERVVEEQGLPVSISVLVLKGEESAISNQ